jgi:hypothetical protein
VSSRGPIHALEVNVETCLISCSIIEADFDSTIKSTIWTGRPLRALATPYVRNWETNRGDEIKALQAKGVIPLYHEMDKLDKIGGITEEIEDQSTLRYARRSPYDYTLSHSNFYETQGGVSVFLFPFTKEIGIGGFSGC